MITMMRMTHSGRTSPTELTFGSTDSWDTWQPYMAWMSTDSRWTFTKNNTTCKETTSKLIFYFFKYFFQLASVLVMFLFYIHFPICFASWVLWRLPTTEKTDQLSFHISHMIFFFFLIRMQFYCRCPGFHILTQTFLSFKSYAHQACHQ